MGCRTCVTSNWAATPTADVRALPGVRYYLARAGDLSRLVAPPYDVISDSDLEHYRSLSPYNVVHLTRPGTDYQGAAPTFERWLDDSILEPDARSRERRAPATGCGSSPTPPSIPPSTPFSKTCRSSSPTATTATRPPLPTRRRSAPGPTTPRASRSPC